MALFRQRKSASGTKRNKLNYHDNGNAKEEVLQGQVDDLQDEMKRLNKRLVAMQAKVQNTGSMSPSIVNFPTPLFSLRPGIHPEAYIDGPSLRRDQLPRNQSFRKLKGREDVFVPHEIDFVSNKLVYHRKITARPDKYESPSPVEEISIRNEKETEDVFSNKMSRTDMGDSSYSTNKVMLLQHCKNIRNSSLKGFGDAESTTSSQRSTYTTKNRRKVRLIVRKVRAAPPPESATNTSAISRAIMPREKDETRSTLSPIIRNHQLSEGLSTKRPEHHNEHSRIKLSDVFIDDSKELLFSTKLSTHSNRISNEDDSQTRSRQTRTSPFAQHHKVQYTNNSIFLDRLQERQINITVKKTKVEPDSSDKNTPVQPQGSILNQTACDIIDQQDTEIVLHRPDLDAIKEFKPCKVLSSNCESVGYIQPTTALKHRQKPRTTALVYSKPSNTISAGAQINAKSKHIPNSVVKCLDSTSGLLADTRTGAKSNRIDKSTEKAPNPKSDLLANIRSGVKLSKVKNSIKQNLSPSSDFRKDIREGIKRGRVESSTATSPLSSANLLELKNVDTSPITSQNPKVSLLDGIKAGVKLKQVDRSSLQGPKKRETPMSTLLARIQKRKEECLRRERPSVENPEQSEIDW